MKKVVVLITGSRSINDREKVFAKLNQLLDPRDVFTLIEGEAEGVDIIARDWCQIHYVHVTPMPIPPGYYEQYKGGAGNRRNQDMLDKAIEVARVNDTEVYPIALWDGSSTGTMDMINRMKKAGLHVNVTLMGTPKTKRLI